MAEEAVLYGKDTSAYNKNKLIKNKSKETHEIQMSLVYDETQIGNIEKDIKKAVDREIVLIFLVIKLGILLIQRI